MEEEKLIDILNRVCEGTLSVPKALKLIKDDYEIIERKLSSIWDENNRKYKARGNCG